MHRFVLFLLFILLFSFQFSFSQELQTKKADSKKAETGNIKLPDETQAAGDKIIFKDGSTKLLEIENLDNAGGLILYDAAVSGGGTGRYLMNLNGNLMWNGSQLGLAGASDNDWTISGNNIYNSNTGNVGIGTTAPNALLSVGGVGYSNVMIYAESSENTGAAIQGDAIGPNGFGVYGAATNSNGSGVNGYASNSNVTISYGGNFRSKGINGRGVFGLADGTTGANYGGEFISNGPSGYGSYSEATGAGGYGVKGVASETSQINYGGYFESKGKSGYGLYAVASDATTGVFQGNIGGRFEAKAGEGVGVLGVASNLGAFENVGGSFQANGESGIGVRGYAGTTSGTNYGGKFEAKGASGFGIWAKAPSTGWAGYFDGRVNVQSANEIIRMESSSQDGWLSIYTNFGIGSQYIGYLGAYNGTNDLDFGTSGSGGNVNLVTQASPRLTVANNGYVGIGTTTPLEPLHVKQSGQEAIRIESGSHNWTIKAGILGDFFIAYNGVNKASISKVDGTYSSYSDRRLKNSIRDISNVLPAILELKPVNYYFNDDITNKEQIGLIAQDVELLFPEAVSEKDGYKAINYSVFGVLAIEAIKEQQTKIDDLEARLASLEARIGK